MTNRSSRSEVLGTLWRVDKVTTRPNELAEGINDTCCHVWRRRGRTSGGDVLHSSRHRHLPTSQAYSSGTTMWVTSANAAAVVTGLCRMDDYFANQLSLVLVEIHIIEFRNISEHMPKVHKKMQ